LLGELGIAAWPYAGAIAARLNDDDFVRENACYALGKMGPAGAAYAPALFARLHDKDEIEDVVEAAAEALRQLGFM
jgi:HEAT repeat protein